MVNMNLAKFKLVPFQTSDQWLLGELSTNHYSDDYSITHIAALHTTTYRIHCIKQDDVIYIYNGSTTSKQLSIQIGRRTSLPSYKLSLVSTVYTFWTEKAQTAA